MLVTRYLEAPPFAGADHDWLARFDDALQLARRGVVHVDSDPSHRRDPSTMKLAEALHELRSSDCSTALFRPDVSADDFRGIDNGYTEGGVAISLSKKTYAGACMAIQRNSMPVGTSPVVDFRMCVWDYETRALRATTDNLADEMNALPLTANMPEGGYLLSAEFLEPLSLRAGEWVIAGNALYGDYPARNISISSMNCMKALMHRAPQLGFNNKPDVIPATQLGEFPTGGYEGGIPGPVGPYPSGNYPWMDLT